MSKIEINDDWVNFVNEYRNLRELWDVNCDSYKIKSIKDAAYEKLTKEYRKIDKHATVETVKKRIKNMRFAYKRELMKKIDSERRGTYLYEPTLWYFNQLDFLNDLYMPEDALSTKSSEEMIVPTPPTKTVKRIKIEENYDRKPVRQSVMPLENPPTKTVKRKKSEENYERKPVRQTIMPLENVIPEKERDEADIYGEGWAQSYRKLTPKQKLFAKKACDEIFILGQLGKLRFNSVRAETLPSPSPVSYRSSSYSD